MSQNEKIRVMVADDQNDMIDSLELYFQHSQNINLVAKANSGKDCLRAIEGSDVDLILMDIKMETKTAGIIAAEEILRQNYQPPKIVFITAFPERNYIKRALDLDCSFVEKTASIPRIIQIIEEVFFNNKLIIEFQLN